MSEPDQEIKWPSERIPQGGLFHAPKVQYSKDTNELINLLMKESRLSMMVRKKMNYHLRNGDPLPLPEIRKPQIMDDNDTTALFIMRNASSARRKSLESIKASGAYEPLRYRPIPNYREPIEMEKLKLQEKMCGMKLGPTNFNTKKFKIQTKPKPKTLTLEEQINEFLEEINERADWLAEMEELGEGRKHRNIIQTQIADKLRSIRMLEKQIDEIDIAKKSEEMIQIFPK